MDEIDLLRIMPHAGVNARLYLPHLLNAMTEFDINTPARQSAFLAQLAHESGELKCVEENLNYSAEALMRVWPARFPPTIAAGYARQPQKIANRAYADRMGNGNEASGDGYRYRGAGLIQLTGKDNQMRCGMQFGIQAEQVGDWLRTREGACRSAGWFWRSNDLNPLADGGQFVVITKKINGGINGLADRQAYYAMAKQVFA
jgi:putative chitinase